MDDKDAYHCCLPTPPLLVAGIQGVNNYGDGVGQEGQGGTEGEPLEEKLTGPAKVDDVASIGGTGGDILLW